MKKIPPKVREYQYLLTSLTMELNFYKYQDSTLHDFVIKVHAMQTNTVQLSISFENKLLKQQRNLENCLGTLRPTL